MAITANIIHRVFRIQCGDMKGTAFTVDVNRRQYLVTAKHVIDSFERSDGIDIFGNGKWNSTPTTLVGRSKVDIAVLAARYVLTPHDLPVTVSSDGMMYGQETYFLGFPYGLEGDFIFGNEGLPLPFVKRALLSHVTRDLYVLDGHNNPGFSGGPLVFSASGDSPNAFAGVISGFYPHDEPIYEGGQRTQMTFKYNTGIVHACKIEDALELIRTNPIGVELP